MGHHKERSPQLRASSGVPNQRRRAPLSGSVGQRRRRRGEFQYGWFAALSAARGSGVSAAGSRYAGSESFKKRFVADGEGTSAAKAGIFFGLARHGCKPCPSQPCEEQF